MTSFYIIKNVNEPKLHFFSKNDIPFSSSFFYFLNRDLHYLKKNYKNVNEIQKVLQCYSLLDKIHPETKEIKDTNQYYLYYELMNIFQIHKIKFTEQLSFRQNYSFSTSPVLLQVFEDKPINPFSFLSFTKNPKAIKEFINKQYPHKKNTICCNRFHIKNMLPLINSTFQKKFDVLFFELPNKIYQNKKENYLLIILYIILFHQEQSNQSMFLFKIRNFNYMLTEFIYILSYIFDSCMIVRSTIFNKWKNEKYILCRKLNKNVERYSFFKKKIQKILLSQIPISSLVSKTPSVFFMNYMNEINNLMGQEQLYFLEQMIHLNQSPNLEEKIIQLKSNQIEKCKQFIDLM